MTNVLQKKSTNNVIVPNFISKCTNYYTNPLIESLFENESKYESDRIYNIQSDIFHKILYKNIYPGDTEDTVIVEKLKDELVYCVCLLLNQWNVLI